MSVLAVLAVLLYALLLLAMFAYGANGVLLVWLHYRHRRRREDPTPEPATSVHVTVQLPIYNEANVVARLLDAVARLDWPRDRLEIQLLDDSTDETTAIAAAHVARLRASGLDIHHVRRASRVGYKAGALAHGMRLAKGELLAIFDADFVPQPDFLRRTLGHFTDPQVAAVQARWEHLNRDENRLTRAQALAIDGHFGVEQAARYWSGWLLNFNGTAGVWRREAIDDGGGWSADTLTEDLDLSYRVQLRGWRLVYAGEVACPAELPRTMTAFKAQQRRWATGSMQTARKMLGRIWRADLSLGTRLQATLHLTHYAIHPLIGLTALLSVPCVLLPGVASGSEHLWAWLLPFALAMSGPTIEYLYGQRVLGRRLGRAVRDLGFLTLVGVGIAVSNARAVIDAFRGGKAATEFVRTPKTGDAPRHRYRAREDGLRRIEVALGAYCLLAATALVWAGVWVVAPFMALDAAGLLCVAALCAREEEPLR